MKFGKHPRRSDYRTLRFHDYLTDAIPAPPASCDVVARVLAELAVSGSTESIAGLFPMDGNDQYGDCTIAAAAHATTVWHALTGRHYVSHAATVEHAYFALTGGDDTGLVELDVLNHWRHHSMTGEKILAYAKVDPHNHDHVKQAIALFGGAYLGFQVQEAALDDFDAGRPWTPGPLTNDGHAVYVVAYDATTVTVLTWGATQKATWGWWDECVDEAYAIVPGDAKKTGFAPGYDLAQLETDLQAITA